MSQRPSVKEIDGKLRAARECVQSSSKRFFANALKLHSDLEELGLSSASEIWPSVLKALNEVKAKDYSGGKPPFKAEEPSVRGEECWQFVWASEAFGKTMFLRFMLKNGCFFYSSLHESRPEKKL